jgi:hypothetical protein
MAHVQHSAEPVFDCIDRTDHSESVQQGSKCKDDRQRGEILAAGEIADAGAQGII